MTIRLFLYFITAYIIGSIPIGDLAARLFHRDTVLKPGDWTTKDSGDVFRILGRKLGILITCLDIIKGWLPVSAFAVNLAHPAAIQPPWIICVGGFLVVFGHCYSIFLGFRGGKGLAPTAGVLFTILPVPAFVSFLFWAALAFWGLSVRPGAVTAAGVMPIVSIIYVAFFAPEKLDYLYIVAALSLLTLWEYRANLMAYLGITRPTPPSPEADLTPNTLSAPPEEANSKTH